MPLFLMYWSYNLGTKAIDILTANAKEFTVQLPCWASSSSVL